MEKPFKASALMNAYAEKETSERAVSSFSEGQDQSCVRQVSWLSVPCLESMRGDLRPFPPPETFRSGDGNGGAGPLPYYCMDAASILAAQTLGVMPGHSVLDLCAAPGGKSLVMLQCLCLWPQTREGGGVGDPSGGANLGGTLISNEPAKARRERLIGVLKDYLPESIRKRHVQVTALDASVWGAVGKSPELKGRFDRVLVDAPCSSDRHVLQSEQELSQWRPGRCKANAQRQLSVVLNGVEALRIGGRLLYATCSINKAENDGVVRRVLSKAKKRGGLRLVPLKGLEKLELGKGDESGIKKADDGGQEDCMRNSASDQEAGGGKKAECSHAKCTRQERFSSSAAEIADTVTEQNDTSEICGTCEAGDTRKECFGRELGEASAAPPSAAKAKETEEVKKVEEPIESDAPPSQGAANEEERGPESSGAATREGERLEGSQNAGCGELKEAEGKKNKAIEERDSAEVFVPFGEPTELGWIVLPDVCDGWGPLYFSLLEKCQDPDSDTEGEGQEGSDSSD